MCACCHFSRVRLFVALWTVAHQAPLSMGFSRQEDWSGVPCPPPGDLPKAGIEPPPLTSPALAGSFFTTSTTWEAHGVLTLNAKYSALLFIASIHSHNLQPKTHYNCHFIDEEMEAYWF